MPASKRPENSFVGASALSTCQPAADSLPSARRHDLEADVSLNVDVSLDACRLDVSAGS